MTDNTWQTLGAEPPTALVDTRLVTHWAAQIVAAVGVSRVPAKPDFSHTNLGWHDAHDAHDALCTHAIGDRAIRAGISLPTLELVVLAKEEVVARRALAGMLLRDGLTWMQETLDERLGQHIELALPEHEMPAHDVGNGAPFPEPTTEGYRELTRWFSNAHRIVSALAEQHGATASPARCWPHHFDLATLITVVANEDPEHARTIGVSTTP